MKPLGKVIAVSAGMLALFAFGFSWRDFQQGKAPDIVAAKSLVGLQAGNVQRANPATLFRQSYDSILRDYYKAVDRKELKYAGLSGLLASLGDPHTQFLEPEAASEFASETRATFAGIGARLSPDPMGARVAVVFEDTPAARAGVKEGDLVTAVNGKAVAGMEIDDIVKQIRGKEGTSVNLTLLRQATPKPLTVTVRRAIIIIPTVQSKMIPGTSFGYIEISAFSEPTAEQFDRALDKLEAAGMKGLVLDVRNNPGGLLDAAVDVLSQFVENKVVVKMRLRDGREEVARTPAGNRHDLAVPMVTLINEDSASAAEIFAGVLRDYRLTTLVGEHSYGKASVQNVFRLIDGASAKITIAKYFLPTGDDISRRVDEDGQYLSGGLPPDVEVPFNIDMVRVPGSEQEVVPTMGDPATDSQLKKALEILRQRSGETGAIRAQVPSVRLGVPA